VLEDQPVGVGLVRKDAAVRTGCGGGRPLHGGGVLLLGEPGDGLEGHADRGHADSCQHRDREEPIHLPRLHCRRPERIEQSRQDDEREER
jgi:hypothetical protein